MGHTLYHAGCILLAGASNLTGFTVLYTTHQQLTHAALAVAVTASVGQTKTGTLAGCQDIVVGGAVEAATTPNVEVVARRHGLSGAAYKESNDGGHADEPHNRA